jgi:hypothetical protein
LRLCEENSFFDDHPIASFGGYCSAADVVGLGKVVRRCE